jgi:hypothetical protein
MVSKLQSRFIWFAVLAILLIFGLVVPRLPFRSNPPQQASDPVVDKIRDDYANTEPWLAMDENARAFGAQLVERQGSITDGRLDKFNKTSAAEQALEKWASQHHPTTFDFIESDPTGKVLLAELRSSYAVATRFQLESIKSAQATLAEIRKEIRNGEVGRINDAKALESVRKRLNDLRESTSDTNPERMKVADAEATKNVQAFVQGLLRKP